MCLPRFEIEIWWPHAMWHFKPQGPFKMGLVHAEGFFVWRFGLGWMCPGAKPARQSTASHDGLGGRFLREPASRHTTPFRAAQHLAQPRFLLGAL
jgi:hypothetical protein